MRDKRLGISIWDEERSGALSSGEACQCKGEDRGVHAHECVGESY